MEGGGEAVATTTHEPSDVKRRRYTSILYIGPFSYFICPASNEQVAIHPPDFPVSFCVLYCQFTCATVI